MINKDVSPMESLGRAYGLRWFWAPEGVFTEPGLYVWLPWPIKRNIRVLSSLWRVQEVQDAE